METEIRMTFRGQAVADALNLKSSPNQGGSLLASGYHGLFKGPDCTSIVPPQNIIWSKEEPTFLATKSCPIIYALFEQCICTKGIPVLCVNIAL